MARSSIAANDSDWSKRLIGMVFLRVDPFASGRESGGGVNQKVASIRLKVRQRLA